jgi:regulatory protein
VERKPKSKPSSELTLKGRALRLLARREHTRRELEQKLAAHVEESAELSALLDHFTARGWISDARFVEQLVHAKRARYGPARIRQLLTARGVADELITPAICALKETEVDAARAVWSRKFRTPAGNAEDRARQVRFLQSRGFSVGAAMRVVRAAAEEA